VKKQTEQTKPKRREVWIYLEFEAYWAAGEALFGSDKRDWRIQCPACGEVVCVGDYIEDDSGDLDCEDAVLGCIAKCSKCGNKPDDEKSILPHYARLLLQDDKDKSDDVDLPIFDFYRGE
jgi:DNA-directed RNA polymerase subunit RPC12/RpoP